MEIENQYVAVLNLTHRMVKATEKQEWDKLTELEHQRSVLVATIPQLSRNKLSLNPVLAGRITRLINEIEHENNVILEHVQVWQQHVKTLLRQDKSAGI